MSKVIFILGLCGSGKSTRAKALASQGFANFDEKATGRSAHPEWANSAYRDLLEAARTGQDCVVTEICFFEPRWRNLVVRALTGVQPSIVIKWECFDITEVAVADYNCSHDPDRTAEGIHGNHEQNLRMLNALRTGEYVLPEKYTVLPVQRRA